MSTKTEFENDDEFSTKQIENKSWPGTGIQQILKMFISSTSIHATFPILSNFHSLFHKLDSEPLARSSREANLREEFNE